MKGKIVRFLVIALMPILLSKSAVICEGGIGDCQGRRRETWILHKGDRLDLKEWCCRDLGDRCDPDPEPAVGFLVRLRPGQRIKVRARLWGQGIRIQCGKPCHNWGNECEWTMRDIPKGSLYIVECRR